MNNIRNETDLGAGTTKTFSTQEPSKASRQECRLPADFSFTANGKTGSIVEQMPPLLLPENKPISAIRRRFFPCRLVFLPLTMLSVASLLLPVLVLIGKVKPLVCSCSTSEECSSSSCKEVIENLKGLRRNLSAIHQLLAKEQNSMNQNEMLKRSIDDIAMEVRRTKETNEQVRSSIRTQLDQLKFEYNHVEEQITNIEGKLSALAFNFTGSSSDRNQANAETMLWLALNSTSMKLEELQSIWSTVNTSTNVLHSTEQWVTTLSEEVKNTSGKLGPIGQSGYNGPKGPAGIPGPRPPGPPHRGGLSFCAYKRDNSSSVTAGTSAIADVQALETKGKKLIGIHCDSNDASVSRLSMITGSNGRQIYSCECKYTTSASGSMYCSIHYWECPIHA